MAIPHNPPSNQWQEPQGPSINTKQKGAGAVAATVAVLASSVLSAGAGLGIYGLIIGVAVAFGCVVLGSLLTISRKTRPFAIGFLIASAILLVALYVIAQMA